ncbi:MULTISPECIES: IS66-like element accessory protein TnpA [unclassified Pseudomonas]|uniref:IS66-like element accessory protein TnpA n=1 Tax=unclassified Pseudomonas TaxID=196821 RepID=UPI002B23986A|nr:MULTISPECIES: transposase [unclassified Pseudomonas]MEA9978571.1 transposase [Pseudomonas sp. RTS4]MEB0196896.1 transposase [Pseudomonas sp. 5S4]MEB0245841.1 transposase [Pseudomonas sp. 10S5]
MVDTYFCGHHFLAYQADHHAPTTFLPQVFKAQVVQECLQPGASIASVALGHGINANLVRKWIPLHRDADGKNLPAFVPLELEPNVPTRTKPTIKIDVQCGQGQLVVNWPADDPEGCARFVRGLAQ